MFALLSVFNSYKRRHRLVAAIFITFFITYYLLIKKKPENETTLVLGTI